MAKARITIPEGSVAIVLPTLKAQDLSALLLEVRSPKKLLVKTEAHRGVAGDVLLAMLDSGWVEG